MKQKKKPRPANPLRAPLWMPVSCVAMLALACLFQFVWFPQGWPLEDRFVAANVTSEIAPVSPVVINEVMSSNKSAWPGAESIYSDWVELANHGTRSVDLSGWTLTDNPDRHIKFVFDREILEPEEYIVVCLTDGLQTSPDESYQAPFKLSASGDALLLYNAGGSVMQAMNVPALPPNTVYALEGASGAYRITRLYTPGLANTRSNHAMLTGQTVPCDAVINEVVAENVSVLKDKDGDFCDWVELTNTGSEPVSLTGFGLSDDAEDVFKWRFPDVTLEPGQYLIVFLSGKESAEDELHAGFRLSAEGESLYFSDDSGRLIQEIDFDLLKADQSWSRDAQNQYHLAEATPGRANPS